MEAIGDSGTIDLSRTRALSEVLSGYTYFREGDVAVAKITPCFENGKGAVMRGLVAGIGFGTTELAVLRPYPDQVTADYLQWLLSSASFRAPGAASMYGAGGQKRVPDEFIRDFVAAFPPLSEQLAITAFLNSETAQIDRLIAKQQRLMDLLQEKRQALVSRVVTKGLDPHVRMKPSGIEWLGEVPTHWDIRRLKTISDQVTVGIVVEPSKYYVERGVPALRSLNVQRGSIRNDGLVYIAETTNQLLGKSRLNAGDLVAVRSGQPGATAVVPRELDGCNCIDLIIIRKPRGGSEHFLCSYLNSDAAARQFYEGAGGAIQQHFNVEAACNLVVVWPPKAEQLEIVKYLRRAATQFDELIQAAKTVVSVLRERRIAIVSAAVTGQIDVRGYKSKTATPSAAPRSQPSVELSAP